MAAEVPFQSRDLPFLATKESTFGKTYIVTGANVGLGFEASKHLVSLGAKKVIIAVRSIPSGEAAKKKIDEATGTSDIADVWALDLSSYDSVKAFAKRAVSELDRIDAVIENAAVAAAEHAVAEGHILPLTVNVLSTFLLAFLLLPKLKESAEKFGILPRLVIVTSGIGFDAQQAWDKVKEDPFVGVDQIPQEQFIATYPISKLFDTFIVRELAAQLPVAQGKVVINAVCPGLCRTELIRNVTGPIRDTIIEQHEKYGRTAEDGSRTLLAGAVLGEGSHGAFLSSCTVAEEKVPDWVKSEDGQKWQKNLWDVLVKEIEAADPVVVQKALH
ncbi:hypothetical protein BJX70DRAFT_360232 [Aspergillus crustosus]